MSTVDDPPPPRLCPARGGIPEAHRIAAPIRQRRSPIAGEMPERTGGVGTLRAFSIRSMVAAGQTEASRRLLRDIVADQRSTFVDAGFIR